MSDVVSGDLGLFAWVTERRRRTGREVHPPTGRSGVRRRWTWAAFVGLAVASAARARTEVADEIPVQVNRLAGVSTADGVLLSGFCWLPPGWCQPQDALCLVDGRRAAFAVQTAARGMYPDGSVRSVGLVTRLPRRVVGAPLRLRRGAAASPARGVRCIDEGSRVLIDNGVLTLAISRDGDDLFPVFRSRLRDWRSDRPARWDVGVAPTEQSVAGPQVRSVEVILAGDLHARIRITGQIDGPLDEEGARVNVATVVATELGADDDTTVDGGDDPTDPLAPDAVAAYRMHLDVLLGSPVVQGWVEVFANGAPTLVDEVAFELPTSVRVRDVSTVPGGGASQGEDGLVVAALDGQRIRAWSGSRAFAIDGEAPSGVICRDRRGGAVGLCARDMRRQEPRAVEIRPDGTLRMVLHAGPLFLEPGVHLRTAFAFGAVDRSGSEGLLADGLAGWKSPALVGGARRGVGNGASCLDPSLDPTARLRAVLDLELARVTGQFDHGDYRIGASFANLEYDPAKSFLLSWLDTGDARDLRTAETMLSHLSLHDLSDGERGTICGAPFLHGAEHRSGVVEAGHVWVGGMALLATVSDAPWVPATLSRMRGAVLAIADEESFFRAERDFGWMLIALVDLQEATPGEDLERAIRSLRDKLLRRQQRAGYFAIDAAEGGALHAPTPWVTAGITVEALHRAEAVLPDEAAAAALARAVDFILRDARYPDGRYAARVRYGEEGEVARDGVADGIAEWMIAAGLSRAARGGHGLALGELEVLLPRAFVDLPRRGVGPNQAARGLVALRALGDL